MKNIKNLIVSLVIITSVGGSMFVISAPQIAYAAADTINCDSGPLGFPTWYRGLTDGPKCEFKTISGKDGLRNFIITIALNIVDIVLRVVAYLSVAYVMYGGILLMTGRGKPDEIAQGQITIRNAVIGLVMSFGAVSVVRFVSDGILGRASTDALFGLPIVYAKDVLTNTLSVVYMLTGMVAVVVIIISGYIYTISGGNPAEVQKAKNSILYAVIGLIVVISAFVMTNFVIGRF
jgi:hypothetical protein